MAQYLGKVVGARGEVTRLGHKGSGLRAQAQGWSLGGLVVMGHQDGQDVVSLFLTHGSHNPGNSQCLGMFKLAADGTFEQVGAR